MNIADQITVLSVFREIEDELSLSVQLENTLSLPLCNQILIHTKASSKDRDVCMEYLHSQKPTQHVNSKFMYDRFSPNSQVWWIRYDYSPRSRRMSSNDDHVLQCNKQRLEFIRYLIHKVEQMSISQTV